MRMLVPLLALVSLLGATFVARGRTAAAPAIVPTTPREAWAIDLLARLGNTQPTADTVAFVVAWQAEENTTAAHNPLATSQDMPGATLFNSSRVKNYQTYQDGLEATAITLSYSYPGYADVLAGLQTNDPQRALAGLRASPWAEEAGYGDRVATLWEGETQVSSIPPVFLPNNAAQAIGQSYLLQGAVGVNVSAALNANDGALQAFTIPPGATWSFGHSIAPISALGVLPVVCGPAGCYAGGGWCDLAALYVRVADQLGLQSTFPAHGGISDARFPGILLDENGDGGDLLITNTTSAPVTFRTFVDGGAVRVEGGIL